MLFAITISRDITQSCTFTLEAESADVVSDRLDLLMKKDAVWAKVHSELDACDYNASDIEVVDVYPAVVPDHDDFAWAINLDTL